MPGRLWLSRSFRNDRQLRHFLLEKVVPTGETLGIGSYGSVVEVQYSKSSCAAKHIHKLLLDPGNEGIQETIEKYRRECQLMASLRHPNITQFLGLCFLDGSELPLLVMEKLEMSVDDLLECAPNIPLSVKVSILSDTCCGLIYLHSQAPPIVHRDLTARNILLTSSLTAKITDMGNSRMVSLKPGQLAQTLSNNPGTTVYMPPEALNDSHRYGPSLDMFSFGHLALYVFTQIFPKDLLSATHTELHNPTHTIGRSEVERREVYIKKLENQLLESHPTLVEIVKNCLHNIPQTRPSAVQLLEILEPIKKEIDLLFGGSLGKALNITNVLQMKEIKRKDKLIKALQVRLERENAELATTITNLEDEVKTLETTNLRLAEDKNVMATGINLVHAENNQLKAENDQLKVDKDQWKVEKEQLTAEKEQLMAEKEQMMAEKEQLIAEKEQLIAEKEQLIAEKEQLIAEKEQLMAEKGEFEVEKDLWEVEKGQFEVKKDLWEVEKDQHMVEKDQWKVERNQLKVEKDQFKKEMDQLKAENDRLTTLNALLNRTHNQLESEELRIEAPQREAKQLTIESSKSVPASENKASLKNISPSFPLKLEWERGPDMPKAMSTYIQAVEISGILYVGGGHTYSNDEYLVMAYNMKSCQWQSLHPYSARYFALTSIHNKLILVGGINRTGSISNKLGEWRPNNKYWTHPFPDMPTARYWSSVATYKNWLVVMAGGYKGYGYEGCVQTVEILNVSNMQWSTKLPTPTPWWQMKSTVIGDTLYLVGGYSEDAGWSCNVYEVSLEALVSQSSSKYSNLWKALPPLNTNLSSPLNLGGVLLAVGGKNGDGHPVSTMQRFVPETNTWVQAGQLTEAVYYCTAIVTSDNIIVVMGGSNQTKELKKIYVSNTL